MKGSRKEQLRQPAGPVLLPVWEIWHTKPELPLSTQTEPPKPSTVLRQFGMPQVWVPWLKDF